MWTENKKQNRGETRTRNDKQGKDRGNQEREEKLGEEQRNKDRK